MKAIINGIEIEGTPEEFMKLIAAEPLTSNDTNVVKNETKKEFSGRFVKSSSSQKKNPPAEHLLNGATKVLAEVMETYLPGTTEFVQALYHYKPKFGGSSNAFMILATSKAYSIRNLAKKSGCDNSLCHEVLQRSVNAGCEISIDNSGVKPNVLKRGRVISFVDGDKQSSISISPESVVRIVSLGTVEQAKSAALSSRVVRGQKKDRMNKAVVISTGSPPITKIRYSEDNNQSS